MTASSVPTFSRQPHLVAATDSEPDARYTFDLHRWLIEWHQEYASTVNSLVTGYLPADGSGTMTGNLAFSGTGLRITADFSNATIGSRAAFQTSTANSSTSVPLIPAGTSTQTAIQLLSDSTTSAAQSVGTLTQQGSVTALRADVLNAGTQGTLQLQIATTPALTLETNLDVALGPSGAATTMSAGFPYIPAAAGAPTGTPTSRPGYVPLYYDTTGNNLYVYSGAWKKVALA